MQDQREIRTIPENHAFFEALGSKPRLQILSLLSEGSRSVSELAQELGLSVTITARHVRKRGSSGRSGRPAGGECSGSAS